MLQWSRCFSAVVIPLVECNNSNPTPQFNNLAASLIGHFSSYKNTLLQYCTTALIAIPPYLLVRFRRLPTTCNETAHAIPSRFISFYKVSLSAENLNVPSISRAFHGISACKWYTTHALCWTINLVEHYPVTYSDFPLRMMGSCGYSRHKNVIPE
jgi:hypothetical protein